MMMRNLEVALYFIKDLFDMKTGNKRKFETNRRIDNNVVVITGANSGIGKETALRLSNHGANVNF